jgi:hypothetical protein
MSLETNEEIKVRCSRMIDEITGAIEIIRENWPSNGSNEHAEEAFEYVEAILERKIEQIKGEVTNLWD